MPKLWQVERGQKYVKISLHGGGSYIQPLSEIENAIEGELDCVQFGEKITIDFEPVDLTDEEYGKLPDFEGH